VDFVFCVICSVLVLALLYVFIFKCFLRLMALFLCNNFILVHTDQGVDC